MQSFSAMPKFVEHILAQAEHSYALSHTALRDAILFKDAKFKVDESESIPKPPATSYKKKTNLSAIPDSYVEEEQTEASSPHVNFATDALDTDYIEDNDEYNLQEPIVPIASTLKDSLSNLSDATDDEDVFTQQYNEIITQSVNEIRGYSQSPKPKDNSNLGCFKAMTEGKCDKPNCSFSHDPNILRQQCKEWKAKMDKELFKDGVKRTSPENNARFPARPPPIPPRTPGRS